MKKKLLIAALVTLVAFVAGRRVLRAIKGDTPVEVFDENETAIRQYVTNLRAGKIPRSPDGRGFVGLDVLVDHGVTHVQQDGNCVVITFGFMPTDAVPQLWYSPSGFSPLPDPIQKLKANNTYFVWHQLREDWGYCEWDN